MTGKTHSARRRGSVWAVFLAYSAWVLWMMLFARLEKAQVVSFGEYAQGHLELIPLGTITGQLALAGGGSAHALANLGGNVLLFAPFGVLLPALLRPLRRFWRFLAVFAGSVAAVETAQLLLRVGFCDVDDLLLNCLGAALGFLLWRWTGSRHPSVPRSGAAGIGAMSGQLPEIQGDQDQ